VNDDPMRDRTRTKISDEFMQMDRALRRKMADAGVETDGHPRVNSEIARSARLISRITRDNIRLMCLLANHAELPFDTDLTGTLNQEWDRLFKSVMKILGRRALHGTYIGTPRPPNA
jgi:hypothetical protein